MTKLLEALPGVPLPIPEVTSSLARMWQPDGMGGDAASEFRASQMNLVLHFGLQTTPEEAFGQFETAIRFAQRYPCRILVLCPEETVTETSFLEGKLFARCYIGRSLQERSCCEALMLGYPVSGSGFLENQVSIWLESDLPTHHWLHRVPERIVETSHLSFMKNGRRIVFDSCVEGSGYRDAVAWPQLNRVRDLAHTRTLPVRQSLGQFLSSFTPAELVEGLREVNLRHAVGMRGESVNLFEWQRICLTGCLAQVGRPTQEIRHTFTEIDANIPTIHEIEWRYDSTKFLHWMLQQTLQEGTLSADFGKGRIHQPFQVRSLSPEEALAEALFS